MTKQKRSARPKPKRNACAASYARKTKFTGKRSGRAKKEGAGSEQPTPRGTMNQDQDRSYTQKPPERKQKVLRAIIEIVDGEIRVFPIATSDQEADEIMLTLWPEGWQ